MFPKIGPLELIIILVIVTMLFGVGKLPEVFGAVGRGIREFRNASKEAEELADDPLSTKSTSSTTSESDSAAEAGVTSEAETEASAASVEESTAEASNATSNKTMTTGADQNGVEPETVGETDSQEHNAKNSSA